MLQYLQLGQEGLHLHVSGKLAQLLRLNVAPDGCHHVDRQALHGLTQHDVKLRPIVEQRAQGGIHQRQVVLRRRPGGADALGDLRTRKDEGVVEGVSGGLEILLHGDDVQAALRAAEDLAHAEMLNTVLGRKLVGQLACSHTGGIGIGHLRQAGRYIEEIVGGIAGVHLDQRELQCAGGQAARDGQRIADNGMRHILTHDRQYLLHSGRALGQETQGQLGIHVFRNVLVGLALIRQDGINRTECCARGLHHGAEVLGGKVSNADAALDQFGHQRQGRQHMAGRAYGYIRNVHEMHPSFRCFVCPLA